MTGLLQVGGPSNRCWVKTATPHLGPGRRLPLAGAPRVSSIPAEACSSRILPQNRGLCTSLRSDILYNPALPPPHGPTSVGNRPHPQRCAFFPLWDWCGGISDRPARQGAWQWADEDKVLGLPVRCGGTWLLFPRSCLRRVCSPSQEPALGALSQGAG